MLEEKDYAYWLDRVPGVGSVSARQLLNHGLSCKDVFEMSSKELTKVLPAKRAKSIEAARKSWDFEKEGKKLKELGIRFIPFTDEEFPEKLKYIDNAPFGIYVKGQLPDPNVPSVAIIGARMCSEYGRFMARQFGRGLAASGVQVISGMARGVDGISQNAALEAGGRSFGVLGCGPDVCYPDENRDVYNKLIEHGGIISEYPPGTQPISNFFPMRNRIISGLSDVVLVVEARQKSGTSITVDTALEQGREVLAVPGRVTDRLSDGCNYLISQGAGIAMTVEDVLDRLWKIKNCSSQPARSVLYERKNEYSGSDTIVISKTQEQDPVTHSSPQIRTCPSDAKNPSRGSHTEDEEDSASPKTPIESEHEESLTAIEKDTKKKGSETEPSDIISDTRTPEELKPSLADHYRHTTVKPPQSNETIDHGSPAELTLAEEILDIIDIIPVSMSSIMEELYRRGKNISIPTLMTELLDLTGSGKVLQNGAYYRKPGTLPTRKPGTLPTRKTGTLTTRNPGNKAV